MKFLVLASTMTALLCAFCIQHTFAESEIIVFEIDSTDATMELAKLEEARIENNSGNEKSCLRLDNAFTFVAKALTSQSYQYLFNSMTPAHKVVETWYENTYKDEELKDRKFKRLHERLDALRSRLTKTENMELTFNEMVQYQLTNKFPKEMKDVDKDLDALINAGFAFPLLVPKNKPSYDDKMRLLQIFLESYKGPDSGGMGNVTMDLYFETPAAPWLFSDSFLDRVIFPMQGVVIPHPKKMKLVASDGSLRKFGDDGWCCCNEQGHDAQYGGNFYRKCLFVDDPDVECMERNGYCKLGTLDACEPGHGHQSV